MNFSSRIFIDGGDPQETRQADAMLKKAGYHGLDGQTTNPSLIAKNYAQSTKNKEQKLSQSDATKEYRRIVEEMSRIIPKGTISIQVIGDPVTLTTEEILTQARDHITWISNGIIKLPCSRPGLEAAEVFCKEGPINITLNFSQAQAAAVYVATLRRGVSPLGKPHEIYISPFVGRLDDKGEKGMDVVANILEMYRALGDGHVKVLTASVRNIEHILYALWLKSDIITIPFKVFTEWALPSSGQAPFQQPAVDFIYDPPAGRAGTPGLTEIPYREISLDQNWQEYDLHHDLTDTGLSRFWEDWKSIVA